MRARRAILLALILGVLTSIGVSWAIAAATVYGGKRGTQYFERQRRPDRGEGAGEVRLVRQPAVGTIIIESVTRAQQGPASDDPRFEENAPAWARSALLPWGRGGEPWPDPNVWSRCAVRGTGWPLVAFWHEYRWRPDDVGGPKHRYNGEYRTPGGIRLEASDGTPGAWPVAYPRALPYRPVWGGCAVNSAIYAGLWAALLSLPGGLRRRLRGRVGGCVRCGYDLSGGASAVCPECGFPPAGAPGHESRAAAKKSAST